MPQRAEVSQALAIGTGESTRYSSTLMEKTMYYAQRLDDGTVLRISISRATVGMLAARHAPAAADRADRGAHPLRLAGQTRCRGASSIRSTASTSSTRSITTPMRSSRRCSSASTTSTSRSTRSCASCGEKTDEFTQITGSMREGLVLLDEHGSVLSINAAAQALFGADAQCVGQGFPDHRAQPRDQRRHSGRRCGRPQRGARRARGPRVSVRYQPHRRPTAKVIGTVHSGL